MTALSKSTPRRLREVREAAGLSLLKVSKTTGIDPSQLSRIERGRANLTAAALGRLVPVLSLTPDDITTILAEEMGS